MKQRNSQLATTAAPDAIALAVLPSQGPADEHPVAIYIASLGSATSRRTMLQGLNVAASIMSNGSLTAASFPWKEVRYKHVDALRAALTEKYAPATSNRILCGVRQVLSRCQLLGLMDAQHETTARKVKSVRGSRLLSGRALTPAEVINLQRGCDGDGPIAVRNRAIVAALAFGGIRRHEAAAALAENYDAATGCLRLIGKGNKERDVHLGPAAAAAIARWLSIRGAEEGPLFCPVPKGGRVRARRPLSVQSIYNVLEEAARRAGVKDVTPHDLRRTFISELLERGHDIATVAKMVGHANLNTTSKYDRRGEQAQKRAAASLDDMAAPLPKE